MKNPNTHFFDLGNLENLNNLNISFSFQFSICLTIGN